MKVNLSTLSAAARLVALAATALMMCVSARAQNVTGIPVTSIIDGSGVNTSPTLRVQSDQLGSYTNSTSKKSKLLSQIQNVGDWELDMLNFSSSPQRKVLVDLRAPVAGSGPNGSSPTAPFAYQLVRARFISKCTDNGLTYQGMQPNTLYFCPLALAFDDANGVRYRLASNPLNFGETNWVQVTCVSTDASAKCNQWKIQPDIQGVTKLLKVATKPNQSDTDMGDFYLSFTIQLTKP